MCNRFNQFDDCPKREIRPPNKATGDGAKENRLELQLYTSLKELGVASEPKTVQGSIPVVQFEAHVFREIPVKLL